MKWLGEWSQDFDDFDAVGRAVWLGFWGVTMTAIVEEHEYC